MIDEAIGKILGMSMAYAASAMGMIVAYVNYRRRIVKADRIMTPAAWAVIGLTLLVTLGGVGLVVQLAAERPAAEAALAQPAPTATAPSTPPQKAPVETGGGRWSWIGIVVPAAVFLLATSVASGLHRHFSRGEH